MRLNHNMESLNIFREYSRALDRQSEVMGRISSGSKINSAKEGPNTLAKSERMRISIRGQQMAQRNVQDGISMMQTADGGLDSMSSILQRARELTIQLGNGANSEDDRNASMNEIKQLIDGYNEIASNTDFNGVKLFGESKTMAMQSGANVEESTKMQFYNLHSDSVGVENSEGIVEKNKSLESIKSMDVNSKSFTDDALSIIDAAMNEVVDVRSKYGALCNSFEGTMDNLQEFEISTQKAESSIRDADIAQEMMNYSKYSILIEAGNAMMVQSNKFPKDILSILENVRSR